MLFLLLALSPIGIYCAMYNNHTTIDSQSAVWQREIIHSVKVNLRINCPFHIMYGTGGQSSLIEPFLKNHTTSNIMVVVKFPSSKEIVSYKTTPSTITAGNEILRHTSKKRGYHKWVEDKKQRWEVPEDHPGQDRKTCLNVTLTLADGGIHKLYDNFKEKIRRTMYTMYNRHAFIHPSGAVGFDCGYYLGRECCETRWDNQNYWWTTCHNYMKANRLQWADLWTHLQLKLNSTQSKNKKTLTNQFLTACTEEVERPIQKYSKVFVIASLWDFNFAHFFTDSLSRLSRHVEFLHLNPDIMIHIRAEEQELQGKTEQEKNGAIKMRNNLFTMLGLNASRIINGFVLADEVYIPRCLHCSFALSNPLEVRLLARKIKSGAKQIQENYYKQLHDGAVAVRPSVNTEKKKKIVILQRYVNSSIMPWGNDKPWNDELIVWKDRSYGPLQAFEWSRMWDNNTFDKVVAAFNQSFPDHDIIRISSLSMGSPDYCFACEINQFAHAEILVGAHGAGLSNMIFMPAGGLTVEIVGHFNDASMPLCGYGGPMAAVAGLHHYIYAYDWHDGYQNSLHPEVLAKNVKIFYQKLHNISRVKV